MNQDWNAGYEKGRDDYCCNQKCNQGRDCPLRKMNKYRETHEGFSTVIDVTHPAKTLTDEEIYKIYCEVEDTKCPSDDFEYMMFARAILRKAQENG